MVKYIHRSGIITLLLVGVPHEVPHCRESEHYRTTTPIHSYLVVKETYEHQNCPLPAVRLFICLFLGVCGTRVRALPKEN